MLSFDITDRNIRVVKGTESNGKIRISSAATLNIEEGLIVNGHVKDVPNVATQINGVLKKNKMPDKEAIVSISSNLTIFKEMNVAKVKNQDLQKVVKQQMQAELNLDDTYSVSYIIVGDAERTDETSEPAYRILATACPNEIVNSYREVFKLLGISLRSVMIGCNCITKVLLADTKIKSKMPLLAVQIDNNFISLNLYEQGQLSFSRFASIDAADYGYSDDYVFEAVNENIFRMLQFHRSRSTGETIENVIFYGDTHEYVRLTDELEKLDLKTSLINVPPQIHGHENLEFSLYANAIGAMFKRNKEVEKINLLETDLGTAVKNKIKSDSSGNLVLAACIGIALIATGAWYAVQAMRDKAVKNDIDDIDKYLTSASTLRDQAEEVRLTALRDQVAVYHDAMKNADDAFKSQPVINGEKIDALIDTITKMQDKYKSAKTDFAFNGYEDGIISMTIKSDASEDMAQKFPADYVLESMKLKGKDNKPYFGACGYEGYIVEPDEEEEETQAPEDSENPDENAEPRRQERRDSDDEEKPDRFSFDVSFQLNGRQSAYVADDAEETTEAE